MKVFLSAVLFLTILTHDSASCAVTVVLARHAEVTESRSGDPGLSAKGEKRAQLLAEMLRDADLKAIWATEYLRTRQTAEPAAKQFHSRTTILPASDLAALVKAVKQRSGTVLVIGHSNTLPQIIEGLGGPKVEITPDSFDNLFVVTVTRGSSSCLRLHYGEAPAGAGGEKEGLMEITFKRSGGFAGMATAIEGKVEFGKTGGRVTSAGGYQRTLGAGEERLLRLMAEEASSQGSGEGPGQLRDGYQYDVKVTMAGGKTLAVSAHGENAGPETGGAMDWVRAECQKIWEHRIGK